MLPVYDWESVRCQFSSSHRANATFASQTSVNHLERTENRVSQRGIKSIALGFSTIRTFAINGLLVTSSKLSVPRSNPHVHGVTSYCPRGSSRRHVPVGKGAAVRASRRCIAIDRGDLRLTL